MPDAQFALIAIAGFAAGAVNALAGGGTLISFPVLVAAGFPAIAANLTSTIALCPGYLGATYAQRAELRGQRARLYILLPVSVLGGLLGAELLLHTGDRRFTQAVPWLLFGACALLALQERLRSALSARHGAAAQSLPAGASTPLWLLPLVAARGDVRRLLRRRHERGHPGGAGRGACRSATAPQRAQTGAGARHKQRGGALARTAGARSTGAWSRYWRSVPCWAACGAGASPPGSRPLWLRRTVVLLGIAVATLYLWRTR